MSNKIAKILLSAYVLPLINSAWGQDDVSTEQITKQNDGPFLSFSPSVSLGIQNYSLSWEMFDDKTKSKSLGNILKVNEYMPMLGIGGALNIGKNISFNVNLQQTSRSIGETHHIWDPRRYSSDAVYHTFTSAERKDYSVALNYAFDFEKGLSKKDRLFVFGGYKHGEAEVKGNYNFHGVENNVPYSENGDINTIFEASGPFVGLNYALKFDSGMLSLTSAFAWLDSKTKDNGYLIGAPSEGESNASGINWGVAWSGPITIATESFLYKLAFDYATYNYDKEDMTGFVNDPDGQISQVKIPFKPTEETFSIKASLTYKF